MTLKKIVLFSALTIALTAGSAAAQVAGSVNATTQPVTSSVAPGTNVSLGTVTLTGVQGGGAVTSLPIVISATNGGSLGNLSSCQLYNNQGTSLTTGTSVINTVNAGTNTFMLNSPLNVNSTTGTVTLTVRCDVSTNSATGSMFTINAAAPTLGPVLRVNLDTAPSVPAGSDDVALANISLGATGANFNVSSIPLTVTSSSNGSTANLTGCVVRNTANPDGALTNVVAITNGSATTFSLATPILVTAGNSQMLSLTCDVQPATAVGSTFLIAVNPTNVSATNAATGASVTPAGIPSGGIGPNGLPASTSGTVIVSTADSTPVPPGTDPDTTPGVPNTGLGSAASMLMMIALAGIIALMGSFYLGRTRA